MSLEAGYVAEPFLVPGDSGLMVNYAQGVEVVLHSLAPVLATMTRQMARKRPLDSHLGCTTIQ